MTRAHRRPLGVALLAAAVLVTSAPAVPMRADESVEIEALEVVQDLVSEQVIELPLDASHIALHWPGNHDATVSVAFTADGSSFGQPMGVEHDEVGEQRGDGRTYGAIMNAAGATAIHVTSDRPLDDLAVVTLDTTAPDGTAFGFGATTAAVTAQPSVIPRAGWGADESLRYDDQGNEIWRRDFWPVQKLIVHHTATGSDQPDPTAAIRAIYYYHAVTQGWGDIGYNFLIDSAGRVYEGRASRSYSAGVSPTGDDALGHGVEAGHTRGYNAGTVGIGMLGTFSSAAPTSAAQSALVRTLAWAAAHHDVDPRGHWTYTNPVNGSQTDSHNIAGHRDYSSTACPGDVLWSRLPDIRTAVAVEQIERIGGGDRYATAAAISRAFFGATGRTVFVATGAGFADALAGGPAAAQVGVPILLTQRDGIPSSTASELSRLRPSRVIVLGGPSAVSDAVLAQLGGYATQGALRVAGSSRYETAAEISATFFDAGVPMAFVATGRNFPDALSGGPVAGSRGAPILLVPGDHVPDAVAQELDRLNPQRVYVLGGTAVVSDGVLAQLGGFAPGGAIRVAGGNRYETSAAVAATFFSATRAAFVATGGNFPDALAGTPPAAVLDAPLLLVGDGVPAAIRAQLQRLMPYRVFGLGGTSVLNARTMTQVRNALGLP